MNNETITQLINKAAETGKLDLCEQKQLDSIKYWGGLGEVHTSEGDVLWKCKEHAAEK